MNKVIEKWDEKYASDELVFGTTPNGFLTQKSPLYKEGAKILCVGDGEGRNGVWLAEQGFHVFSVDGSKNGVDKAIAQADTRKVSSHFEGLCTDLLKWNWPLNSYDGVACLHLYFMPDERPAMHQAMMDSLKENGIFILECFHPDNLGRGCGGPQVRELCYTALDLAHDFNAYKVLHLEETERELAPSSFHEGGMGIVSRIVVQKSKS
ncbi:Methyltransferase type 11 [Candidatus Terasakiella magnetica]|uniref:Methyltransferase type 11 n=1 Tax=Candidatus Terasakiella magnetica TaxID=1867952 RepID=A0A1C3RF97_9PROT|nr:class I SAM-dependent methyltransferase [Candidatus Terasakiella magnetica]SCA55957.1 Methyltransferase type 11 [Candidatus Terasakiella magnetica]